MNAQAAANQVIDAAKASARKEAPGIVKRTNAYFIDPRCVARKPGFNPRFDFGDIDALAASILANGLVNPIRVKRVPQFVPENGNGPEGAQVKDFELIDGDRRLTAIEKILKKDPKAFPAGIPAVLVDKDQDDKTSRIQMFVANDGKPFSPLEEAIAYKRFRDEDGMTIQDICKAVGRAQVHVVEILALAEADESLKEAAKAGTVGKTIAKRIAVVARGDKAKQQQLTQQAVAAGKDKGKQRAVKLAIDDSRRDKAKSQGRVLKMRALSDEQLSNLGAKLADTMVSKMREAGKPLDFDLRTWVMADEALALAAAFGALEALKAAAGQKIDLDF